MTVSKQNKLLALLSTTVALSVIAGCTAPIAQKGTTETTVSKGNPTAVTPAVTANTKLKAGNGDPSGADPNKTPDNANDGAIDNAKVMHISAAQGGMYTSDDGLLTAIFPPGALSQDADIRMTRVDTSTLKNSDVFLNGIRYQVDLGTAFLTPGARVTVSSKADDRLIGMLKSMYTDYTPERYALSKDSKGNWNVTMSMKGATENDPVGFKDANSPEPTRGVMQEGGFPVTAKGGGFKQDSRIEAFCNYAPPPAPASYGNFEAHVTWESDSLSGLAGLPANEAYGGNPAKDARVHVDFSTTYSSTPLPPSYTVTAPAIPAVPAVAAVAGQPYIAPNPGQPYIAPNPGQPFIAPTLASAGPPAVAANPGQPYIAPNPGQPYIAPNPGQPFIAAVAGSPYIPAVPERFDSTEITLPLTVGQFVTGGHPFNGSCNCGGYVLSNDEPVIQGSSSKITDSAGVARIRALQSYDSTVCSAGICAGEPTNFMIFAQAKYRWPTLQPTSLRFIGGGSFGAQSLIGNADSAAGPIPLTIPKYSPFVKITLRDSKSVKYSGPVTMEYQINGVAQPPVTWSDISNINGPHDEGWLVPGIRTGGAGIADPNEIQVLKINKIYNALPGGTAPTMVADPNDIKLFQAYPIQRNNVYAISIDMLLNEAK